MEVVLEEAFLHFEIEFTDVTIREAGYSYEEVKRLMEKEPYSKEWVIPTKCYISSDFGLGYFYLNFYHDGRVFIIEYPPRSTDPTQCPEIQGLTKFCFDYGWKKPQLSEVLIKSALEFWKSVWEINLVDSEYLSKRFGERVLISIDEEETTPDETPEIPEVKEQE